MSPPAPHDAIETVFLEAEAVLYDDRTKSVLRLNPAASAVWLLLDGHTPVDGIAVELAELTGVPSDVLRPDVDAAIAQFAEQHLLGVSADLMASDGADGADSAVEPEAPLVLARPPDP